MYQADFNKTKNFTGPTAPVATYHYEDTRKRAFGVVAPIQWNKLPETVKEKDSLSAFKTALKTYLFRTAHD